jgi:lambda repressor-like predicted transcriptional regulator
MTLQDLVLARLRDLGTEDKPMSARRAAERSRGGVSYDTLYSIARGEHSGRLAPRTVQGIADALDVQPEQVYDAAGIPRPQARWLPPERLDRLTPAQRKLLEDMGAALLDADRRGYERGSRGH